MLKETRYIKNFFGRHNFFISYKCPRLPFRSGSVPWKYECILQFSIFKVTVKVYCHFKCTDDMILLLWLHVTEDGHNIKIASSWIIKMAPKLILEQFFKKIFLCQHYKASLPPSKLYSQLLPLHIIILLQYFWVKFYW